MVQYESSVKYMPFSQERVYGKLSDPTRLNNLHDRWKAMKDKLQNQVETLSLDRDSITVRIQGFDLTLRIVERDPNKCIKFEGVNTPVPLKMWIQILPHETDEQAKMKLTIRAEVNVFMKSVMKKPLQEGVEKLANLLAVMPY